jgi:hypothetical protein
MPNRCPRCGKFTDSSSLDALLEINALGVFVSYCSYTCIELDAPNRRGEEPDIIY